MSWGPLITMFLGCESLVLGPLMTHSGATSNLFLLATNNVFGPGIIVFGATDDIFEGATNDFFSLLGSQMIFGKHESLLFGPRMTVWGHE